MRLVLDTNVLIAAFISHGMCNELFEHVAIQHTVVSSQPLLNEVARVLAEKFNFGKTDIQAAIRLLKSRVEIVAIPPKYDAVCRDADDDLVLATALAGQCKAIISGDKDLAELGSFQGITILKPSEFWQFESAQAGA